MFVLCCMMCYLGPEIVKNGHAAAAYLAKEPASVSLLLSTRATVSYKQV